MRFAVPDRRYERFGLTLMTTQACNLRCTYCYTGEKMLRRMPEAIARRAIERAIASLRPHGCLELSFFGGEPLLDAERLLLFIREARRMAAVADVEVDVGLTTNGTRNRGAARALLMQRDLDLTISFDGLPSVHDRHRRTVDGEATSGTVLATLRALVAAAREFRVLMVVRPDTVDDLPAGIELLRGLGVRRIEPSLDLWAEWTPEDGQHLERALHAAARLWRAGLPDHGLSWFDEKLLRLSGVPVRETARCGFGAGQVAVSPAGHLYPCERLIGEDRDSNPMRLPGRAEDGGDFLSLTGGSRRSAAECRSCALEAVCAADCCCSNYLRTGDTGQPDGLLCLLERVCTLEAARALRETRAEVCDARR